MGTFNPCDHQNLSTRLLLPASLHLSAPPRSDGGHVGHIVMANSIMWSTGRSSSARPAVGSRGVCWCCFGMRHARCSETLNSARTRLVRVRRRAWSKRFPLQLRPRSAFTVPDLKRLCAAASSFPQDDAVPSIGPRLCYRSPSSPNTSEHQFNRAGSAF